MTAPQPQNETYFLGADYLRITDFIKEKREAGRIVVITSMWNMDKTRISSTAKGLLGSLIDTSKSEQN